MGWMTIVRFLAGTRPVYFAAASILALGSHAASYSVVPKTVSLRIKHQSMKLKCHLRLVLGCECLELDLYFPICF
jgi:hypothetical protein